MTPVIALNDEKYCFCVENYIHLYDFSENLWRNEKSQPSYFYGKSQHNAKTIDFHVFYSPKLTDLWKSSEF